MLLKFFQPLFFLPAFVCALTSAYADTVPYRQSQGWNAKQAEDWYSLSQGSRLIPVSWLKALKVENGEPFFTRRRMEGFGYLYFDDANDDMPIGFVVDEQYGIPAVGLNCAACHTGKLKVSKHEVWIHGGQSMADFQSFLNSLITSVELLIENDEVMQSFSNAVLGPAADAGQRRTLLDDVRRWLAWRKYINITSENANWGRGRADAVGVILATTAAVLAHQPINAEEGYQLPQSNAPVSYPFVWNANQQGRLQHNGIVDNGADIGLVNVAKIGALIRNWTEALGVFAHVALDDAGKITTTSIRFDNLLLLEQVLAKLQSPKWPEAFGQLDDKRRAVGEKLYDQNCMQCHGKLGSEDTSTFLTAYDGSKEKVPGGASDFIFIQPLFDNKVKSEAFLKTMTPKKGMLGTDPGMTCNSLMHISPSGKFLGKRNVKGSVPLPGNPKFVEMAVTTDLLRVLIQTDIKSNKSKYLTSMLDNQLASVSSLWKSAIYDDSQDDYVPKSDDKDVLKNLKEQLARCASVTSYSHILDNNTPLPAYKSRPLNGIWATAPYLHNGSVPTLYDLLLPQEKRPPRYFYFDGELDVVKGGLANANGKPNAFEFNVFDAEGFAILGNWNGGHEYGTTLSDEERLNLVEYLKGL